MSRRVVVRVGRAVLVAALGLSLLGAAAPSRLRDTPLEAALRRHVETLASDDFEGREPGTEGETKTLRYLARQWFDIGLESGTNDPGNAWFAPVELVERAPLTSRAEFLRGRKRIVAGDNAAFVVTSGIRSLVENTPVLFVGRGQVVARAELAGRIALMLDGNAAPDEEARRGDRAGKLLDAGASAVITVLDGSRTLEQVVMRRRRAGYALASERLGGDIEAFITPATLGQVAGGDVAALRHEADAPDFAPRLMGFNGTLEATSRETRIRTHNLIGKLPGRRPADGAVLLVAHWDHFGKCAEPPAEHRICNGAIDNASGLAVVTEVARQLSRGRKLDRDVYFLATTGEELGLLGALAFAENPPLPLDRFVAAFNVDSTGLVARGMPVSIIGRGMTSIDGEAARVIGQMRRKLAAGNDANAYMKRQDGWVLIQHDVPTIMVSTSYSDQARLTHFMETDYHRPSDTADKVLYGGMADDVDVQTELVRHFADARQYPRARIR